MKTRTLVALAFAAGLAGGLALQPSPTQPTPVPIPVLDNQGPTLKEFVAQRQEAQRIMSNFSARAGIVRPISLAVGACPVACVDIGIGSATAYVFIEEALLFRPRIVLEKVIAHEIGHVAAGHVYQWKGKRDEEKSEAQYEADAYAMCLMGEARYREYLKVIDVDEEAIERHIVRLKAFDVRLPPQADAAKALI